MKPLINYHVRNGDPFFERRVTPIEEWNDISTIGRTSLCVSIGSGNYDHSVASGSRWVKSLYVALWEGNYYSTIVYGRRSGNYCRTVVGARC